MEDIFTSKPPAQDLQEPLERQSPDQLESIANYAAKLAARKRTKHDIKLVGFLTRPTNSIEYTPI